MYRVMKGDITVPYQWTTGPIYGKFLSGLTQEEIWGLKCPDCNKVYVPPQEVCPKCYRDMAEDQFVSVSQEGTVVSYTKVERHFFGEKPSDEFLAQRIQPADYSEHPLLFPPDPPYAMALIQLDGTDSCLLHLVKEEDMDKLQAGGRVKAEWKEGEKEGYILDLESFKVIE